MMNSAERVSRRQSILEAARITLRERGLEAIRMDDIAGRVGIARPNLYRYFSHKDDLVKALLEVEILETHRRRRHRIPLRGPVRPILVESLVQGSELARGNELLSMIFADGLADVTAKLVAMDDHLLEIEFAYWRPVLEHGRARHEIRTNLTDDRIMRWFMTNHYVLMTRPELVGDDVRSWLEDFVVTPILADVAPGSAEIHRKAT